MGEETRVSLIVPSRVDHLDLVQVVAERVARWAGMGQERSFDLSIAVREGAVNAMKHGHGFDPGRCVRVDFRTSRTAVEVSILDEGSGFDPANTPDPRAPQNLMRSSGRGLFLITSLVDHVRFVQHVEGMEVILLKELAAGPQPAGLGR